MLSSHGLFPTLSNKQSTATTVTTPPRLFGTRSLGIDSDDVANYCFPKEWPANREQRALIIGDWLQTEARFLGRQLGSWPLVA
jgi:hypothetical protein